ncbi:hypothetical protein [Nocardioides sp. YR527]|uniref:hypothetical protein n=1 Tax=Nocardioides sp. YR527 TaxID=1881028 RepID=UPI00115FF59F|nr:hypothetical protein [Nocardioides sp. YR527]
MAIQRPPQWTYSFEKLRPVALDRQDLRDIVALLEPLVGQHGPSDVRISVNDYTAETLTDVFEFERTVEEVRLHSPDLSITLTLRGDFLTLLFWDTAKPPTSAAVTEIKKILDARSHRPTSKAPASVVRALLMMLVGGSLGWTIAQQIGLSPASGYALAGQVTGAVIGLALSVRAARQVTVVPLLIEQQDKSPWWKRNESVLMLLMTAAGVIAGIIGIFA